MGFGFFSRFNHSLEAAILAAGSRDYLSLATALQKVLFMGDGLTSGSLAETIIAPAGATRLYLGTMDRYSWSSNIGSFEVTLSAVTEPATKLLLASGLVGLAGIRRRLHKN